MTYVKSGKCIMVEEDLDEKFKDTSNPLRLVFVCAMSYNGQAVNLNDHTRGTTATLELK